MATPLTSNFTRLTSADLLKLKRYLIEQISRSMEGELLQPGDHHELMKQRLQEVYIQTRVNLPDDIRKQIFKEILDEVTGYGPIQPLLDDPDISEVMVNGPKKVFIEKSGRLTKTPITFDDDNHVLRVIDRIILPLGRRVDADSPTVDARLPDGSRVNAIVPPLALDGSLLSIRKFAKKKIDVKKAGGVDKAYRQLIELMVDDSGKVAEWGRAYIHNKEGYCCGLPLKEIKGKDNCGKCPLTGKIFELDDENEFVEVED